MAKSSKFMFVKELQREQIQLAYIDLSFSEECAKSDILMHIQKYETIGQDFCKKKIFFLV